MMIYSLIFSIFMYFVGLSVFNLKSKHLLLMLLSLEFIVLSLYLGLYICLSMYLFEYFFMMIFLTMSVCEGALGLSILVSMVRSYGNDYFNSFNILW
uniref:NADH-ubiquinone oxidoreductase chain 4L n=1 Tax=Drilaster sp. BMNH 840462 TaxID=904163 RepID=E3VTA5_9COLE|nr:NADH dehydrogenase subunit 4L [Drilaster sp. BMNH 840462]